MGFFKKIMANLKSIPPIILATILETIGQLRKDE